MSHNDDNSGMLYIGGVLVVVIVVGFLIKILKAIMIELSALFTEIAKMASAFISMAGQIALVLGLLSLGVAAVYAAWIFTKKYYQLVKDATEVKAQIDNRFSGLQLELMDSYKSLKREAVCEINQMRKELDLALKRSEVIPKNSDLIQVTHEIANTLADSETTQTADDSASESIDVIQIQIQDAPKDISNPF